MDYFSQQHDPPPPIADSDEGDRLGVSKAAPE
jgi:hypothetical protein